LTNTAWRRDAKELLYNYTTNRVLLYRAQQDILYGHTPARDNVRRGGAADPTMMKAHMLNSAQCARLKQETAAVEALFRALHTTRRIDRLCAKMLELVYVQGRTSLLGAAAMLGISERTAKRWNQRALVFVAQEMGWLQQGAAGSQTVRQMYHQKQE